MKLPRYSLRTLFALITLVGCWSGYQLNWIRQRHDFYAAKCVTFNDSGWNTVEKAWLPWGLKLFGETPRAVFVVKDADKEEAVSLFPESVILSDSVFHSMFDH